MRRSLQSLFVLVALLACGGEVAQADRDEVRAKCAKEPGFDQPQSDAAFAALKTDGCRDKSLLKGCADWWNHTVTACVYTREAGAKEIHVHSDLFVETDTHREYREGMCDAVNRSVVGMDLARVVNSRGQNVTLCGKRRSR
jgi:hypothetical protein